MEISTIHESPPKLSVNLFDNVLATFLECHNACHSNTDIVRVVDRNALDFRNVCNIGATSLEKASSDFYENCILWYDNIGDAATEHALRDQMITSSKEFSIAFGEVVTHCENFLSQFTSSPLMALFQEQKKSSALRVTEAKQKMEEARQKHLSAQEHIQELNREKHSTTQFPVVQFFIRDDDSKRAIKEQEDKVKLFHAEMIRTEKEHTDAQKKADEASALWEKVEKLSENVKNLMSEMIQSYKESAEEFQNSYQYFTNLNSESLPSTNTAQKESESYKKKKEKWDIYYTAMLIATSKHNFIPSTSVPRSELAPVNILGTQYTF